MKAVIAHPATLIVFAFALLIAAWSVIVTTAVKHRSEQVPLSQEAPAEPSTH